MHFLLFIFTAHLNVFCVPCIFMMAEMVNIDHRLNEICQAYFILVPQKGL